MPSLAVIIWSLSPLLLIKPVSFDLYHHLAGLSIGLMILEGASFVAKLRSFLAADDADACGFTRNRASQTMLLMILEVNGKA
jgi:hypothetical protein